jgi:hypothetical protein
MKNPGGLPGFVSISKLVVSRVSRGYTQTFLQLVGGWQQFFDVLLDLRCLYCAACFGVVNTAAVEVVVGGHEGVLVVDGDVEALHGAEGCGIAFVDARVGGSAGVCGLDGGGSCPD